MAYPIAESTILKPSAASVKLDFIWEKTLASVLLQPI